MPKRSEHHRRLDKQARDILISNDRGGFTVPTARLYPFQWNWDSAFCALGFARFDRPRAWCELHSLLDGQWDDGMVPHIIFRRDDSDYFPGPSVWQTNTVPPSSGHSQPPVLASVVHRLVVDGDGDDEDQARSVFERILRWHRWYQRARDPGRLGVIATMHPWETGRDNCPDWDGPLSRVAINHGIQYTRRDTAHVGAEQRPSDDDYDRFLSLLNFGRECGWNSETIARYGQFWVADPGINFILLRANRDLLALAERFDEHSAQVEIKDWIARAEDGIHSLWNDKVGGYCARDLRTGMYSDGLSSASMLAYYAGVGNGPERDHLDAACERLIGAARYAMPSWDPAHRAFDAVRYWRGPVWLVVNFMIAQGLREQGRSELAQRILDDSTALVENAGFYEYFCPMTGAGCGGGDFSWTAAMWLAFASPTDVSDEF